MISLWASSTAARAAKASFTQNVKQKVAFELPNELFSNKPTF
jgi:hypothetical protein